MSAGHTSIQYRRKAIPRRVVRPLLRRQQQRLYERYALLFPPRPEDRVLDLGVNGSLESRELHFFEQNYPYRDRIVAAGLESPDLFKSCYPEVPYQQLKRDEDLPFPDQSFEVVFCNAVIEHVGDRDRQRRFLAEIARVGRAAFVTTPNRWYPVELHTVLPLVHWLPSTWYRAIFRLLGFSFFSDEANLNLLDRRALEDLLPAGVEATTHRRRLAGFTSNLLLEMRRGRTEPTHDTTSRE
jgi:hypothetical protein